MNQAELIAHIAADQGLNKTQVTAVFNSLREAAYQAVRDDSELTLPGIGKISVKAVPARTGRNPKTGEAIAIPAKIKPRFSAAKTLKDWANG